MATIICLPYPQQPFRRAHWINLKPDLKTLARLKHTTSPEKGTRKERTRLVQCLQDRQHRSCPQMPRVHFEVPAPCPWLAPIYGRKFAHHHVEFGNDFFQAFSFGLLLYAASATEETATWLTPQEELGGSFHLVGGHLEVRGSEDIHRGGQSSQQARGRDGRYGGFGRLVISLRAEQEVAA
jgi:hypothetical protein